MFTIGKAKVNLYGFFKSRGFIAAALSLICAFSVLAVGFNTRKVTITDGKESVTLMTMKDDPDEILEQAGIDLEENDKVVVARQTSNTLSLSVKRAIDVRVTADGKSQDLVLYGGSVIDAFAYAGIEVNQTDLCNLPLDAPLTSGMEITLDRITYRDASVTEEVPFEAVSEKSDTLLKGKTKVSQEGVPGVRTIVSREMLVNGEVVSSRVISDEITVDPVDEITLVGTKVEEKKVSAPASGAVNNKGWSATAGNGILVDHNGNQISYSSYIDGKATAYTPSAGGINGGSITSIGLKAEYGIVAVNPNIIPYGTKLYICSPDGKFVYGYAIAGDTGGGVMAGYYLADLCYNTYSECVAFGVRNMRLYILN